MTRGNSPASERQPEPLRPLRARRLATPAQLVEAALDHIDGRDLSPAEWARITRQAEGLPPVVTDPVVLRNIRTIVHAALENPVAPVLVLKPKSKRAGQGGAGHLLEEGGSQEDVAL
jgi:hypothetical protein